MRRKKETEIAETAPVEEAMLTYEPAGDSPNATRVTTLCEDLDALVKRAESALPTRASSFAVQHAVATLRSAAGHLADIDKALAEGGKGR